MWRLICRVKESGHNGQNETDESYDKSFQLNIQDLKDYNLAHKKAVEKFKKEKKKDNRLFNPRVAWVEYIMDLT